MEYFSQLLEIVKLKNKKIIAVACAQDEDVLEAIEHARKKEIIDAILIGNEEEIRKIAKKKRIDLRNYEIINILDINEAARNAVELVSKGKAHILMKGLVDTSIILKAVLDLEIGLRIEENLLSHVGLFYIEGYDRPFILTDAAMNIAPNLEEKIKIINNAVKVAISIGIEVPKVACLCAKEKVFDKMSATIEAAELERLNKLGNIKNCIIGGPLALDNAVSQEAARHKGIIHPVAGKADILMVPDIEAGNILYKAIIYFSKAEGAGMIVGAKAPIVLTSRADSKETKFNSILLATAI